MSHCPDSVYEQTFFKYFTIRLLVLEKMCADGGVCWSLGLNEFMLHFTGHWRLLHIFLQLVVSF
jgi:hypothetical protein